MEKTLHFIKQRYVNVNVKGCDTSEELVEITRRKEISCDIGNILDLSQFKQQSFDIVLCVAVLHYVFQRERRIIAIQKLFNLLSSGGTMFIQVWAYEHHETSKRKFEGSQDQLVSWKNNLQRYCHLFVEGELEKLVIDALEGCNYKLYTPSWSYGNWSIMIDRK